MINNSMKQEIIDIITVGSKKSRKNRLTPQMIEYLNQHYPVNDFAYQCELILLEPNIPKCVVCGQIPNRGKQTCSRECREQYKKIQGIDSFSAAKKSLRERYGVNNPAKVPSMQQKRLDTVNKIYGANVSPKTREKAAQRASSLNQKAKRTIKQRYDVDNVSQLPDHAQKVKDTLMKNYGVDNYFFSDEWNLRQQQKQLNRIESMLDSIAEIIDISSADFDLQSAYDNPNDRVTFKCKSCESIETIPTETLKYRLRNMQTPCGSCSGIIGKSSYAESQIADWIEQHYQGTVIRNDRTMIAPYELDILLPDLKIAIEYCGLYWHNDQRINKKYHRNKFLKCQQQGYQLITIFEDEWIHKCDIVKQRLLVKLRIAKHLKRIWARQCQVRSISASDAREFVESSHIQGYANSNKKYGLYHHDRLVAVMTFANSNISKKQTGWELSRFCVKPGYVIPGAAGKLFTHFLKQEDPSQVVTFSDLRWNTGNVYEQIGFRYQGFSGINYWYIQGNRRLHRFLLRKQKSDPQNLTETELRRSQGWLRIWDCGNAKYIYEK